jgi:hypothetical protein
MMDGYTGRRRLFTLAEANALVPRVGRVMGRLQRTAMHLADVQRRLQLSEVAAEPAADGDANVLGKRLYALMEEADHLIEVIQATVDELESLGCELKDVQQGLVDFRSVRDGEEVYLCWRQGEERITFWHTLESGFAGRQPI